MNNQNLLSQTYNQIQKGVFGDGSPYFQMLARPMNFSWPIPPTGQMSSTAYQLISMMPKWSDVASYAPGDATFFDAYRALLGHVTFKVSPEKQNDLNNLQNQLNQALRAKSDAQTAANTAYQTEQQNGGAVFTAMYPTLADWLKDPNGGGPYLAKITSSAKTATALADDYADKAASLLDGRDSLKEALKATTTPDGTPGRSPSPAGWTKVANNAGDLEWQPVFNIGTSGQDWRAKLTGGTQGQFSVQLDASRSETDYQKSWAGGSASYGNLFWGVSAGGSWERMDLAQSDASVRATISVESSTLVAVTPGKWYDGGFMEELARNANGSGYAIEQGWSATGDNNAFFGANGLLGARINQLVVVYKPKVEITMNSSTFNQYREKFEVSGGLRIGPFSFGASGGQDRQWSKSTSNGTTFTAEDTSGDPLIIGITCAFPGVGHP